MPTNQTLTDAQRSWPPISFIESEGEPYETFEVYREVGNKIMEWANGKNVPIDMSDLRAQLNGLVDIPANMKTLCVVQGDDNDPDSTTFVLRLPPRNQLNESERQRQQNKDKYPLPGIYESSLEGSHVEVKGEDMLRARVADYTMRGCR